MAILNDGIKVLLDASIDHETLREVEKIIINTAKVSELKNLSGRNSGRFKFIEAIIVVQTYDLDEAHCIADKIEQDIKNKIRNIAEVLIHYEPICKTEVVYALPLTVSKKKIHEHFGEAPYFMLARFKPEAKRAFKVEILENPYDNTEKSKGILTAEFLARGKVDKVISRHTFNNKGPMYVFSDAKIEIILTKRDLPEEALKDLGLKLN
jgi:predicted Fe-Mo cluster-binding NifX family protein